MSIIYLIDCCKFCHCFVAAKPYHMRQRGESLQKGFLLLNQHCQDVGKIDKSGELLVNYALVIIAIKPSELQL